MKTIPGFHPHKNHAGRYARPTLFLTK